MSHGQHNSAHSYQWKGASSRAARKDSKLKRGGRPIDLKRLEELLRQSKEPRHG